MNKEFKGFRTIGEYIENLSKDNDYAKNIISQYTQDVDPTIRIANVINTLPESTQKLILKLIVDEKSDNEQPKEVDVISYTSANLNESVETLAGKKIFQSFLKVITALGQKEISQNFGKCPKNFIFYFETNILSVDEVKSVMSRYPYFDNKINQINYIFNDCNIYYGINIEEKFEYGIRTESEFLIFGKFVMTENIIKYFLLLSSPSSKNLKKQLSVLNFKQIQIMGKVKQAMFSFYPPSFENKPLVTIIDNILSYGYTKQDLNLNEVENIKSNLKSFLIPFSWSDMIQISVSISNNYLFLNIKIK
jgi:hypothetical protein